MSRVAVFTSATYSYLSRARTLAHSLKRFHPDWHMCLVLPDDPPPGIAVDWKSEPFDAVLGLQDLELPAPRSWLFKHNVVELCTAVKGFALTRLQAEGYDEVFYLDPDIAVFGSLEPVLSRLRASSIVLTPHQTRPEATEQGVIDNERTSLKYGIYNLGFLGVKSDAAGRGFAQWWRDRCSQYCRDDVADGLFTDQRWCDLVPALFDGVSVLRDAGLNVASWNIGQRRISTANDGAFCADGVPLRFFHFTKVDHIGETMLRRYAGSNLEVLELMYWYRRQLAKHAVERIPERYWAHASYDDGTPIPQAARVRYRAIRELEQRFPDPFAVGPGSFKAYWDAAQEDATRARTVAS